jgi:hypothetical protein
MLKFAVALVAVLMSSGQAMAWCYEDIGCDDEDRFRRSDLRRLSCQALYEVRNGIYAQNGYCFKTERAINTFGNEGCWIEDQEDVQLSSVERYNVSQIVAVERQKGC